MPISDQGAMQSFPKNLSGWSKPDQPFIPPGCNRHNKIPDGNRKTTGGRNFPANTDYPNLPWTSTACTKRGPHSLQIGPLSHYNVLVLHSGFKAVTNGLNYSGTVYTFLIQSGCIFIDDRSHCFLPALNFFRIQSGCSISLFHKKSESSQIT